MQHYRENALVMASLNQPEHVVEAWAEGKFKRYMWCALEREIAKGKSMGGLAGLFGA